MAFNARSLCNKTVGVCTYLKKVKCDVCFISEAWIKLKDKSTVAEIKDMGYDIKFRPRKGSKRGGGVCVLYKPDLNVDKCTVRSFKTFEVMQTTIKGCDDNLLRVSTFYRTGQLSVNERTAFINELDEYLESVNELKGEHILCGDFNIHVEDTSSLNTKALYSTTESFGYTQIVNEATHQGGGTLDLIFLKLDSRILTLAKQSLHIHDLCYSITSDHNFIEFMIPFVKNPPKPLRTVSSYRDYKNMDIDKFCCDTENIIKSLHCNYFKLDVDDAVTHFEEALKRACDEHAPLVTKCFIQKRTDFTNDKILSLRRLRRRHERLYRKHRQVSDYNKFKYYEREVHKAVHSSRNEFYGGELTKAKGDKKQTFKLLNRVLGTDKVKVLPDSSSDIELCNEFETFFTNKIVNIRRNISKPSVNIPKDMPLKLDISIEPFNNFMHLSESDLLNIMSSMGNKYCDLDVLPADKFKECSKNLLTYILHIINLSFSTGTFPTLFKKALLNPAIKNATLDKNIHSNYRPVSNLCFFSKLLEKCVSKQLINHLERNDLLCNFQSAYRQFHSCETAMAKISNDILINLDCNDSTFLILLDMSAAFDTVDHAVLIDCLKNNFKVGGQVLKWFTSYLSGRSFHVKINSCLSKGVIIFYGVPQGSILGPILFLLYISEIEKIAQLHGFSVHVYADDMQLYISFKRNNLLNTISSIEHCLCHIKNWMASKFLKINESKTQLMIFIPKTHYYNIFSDVCLSFGGSTIFPSVIATNLGITLDNSMSMSSQINSITSKGYFYLHNFYKVADKLNYDLKVQLITTYILPLIDYCNVLYTCSTKSYRHKLQKLLNSSARFIFNLKGRRRKLSVTPYLKKTAFSVY